MFALGVLACSLMSRNKYLEIKKQKGVDYCFIIFIKIQLYNFPSSIFFLLSLLSTSPNLAPSQVMCSFSLVSFVPFMYKYLNIKIHSAQSFSDFKCDCLVCANQLGGHLW